MDLSLFALAGVLVAIAVILAARRFNELFVLRLSLGRLRHVRGRVPRRLLEDWRDILAEVDAADAELRVVLESGVPRLIHRGELSDSIQQRLRNVLGRYRVAELRSGAPPPRRRRSD